LLHAPEDRVAQTILAASLIGLEQYTAARVQLTPVEKSLSEDPAALRAMVSNALAVALLLKSLEPSPFRNWAAKPMHIRCTQRATELDPKNLKMLQALGIS
jgi:hypothetical protein